MEEPDRRAFEDRWTCDLSFTNGRRVKASLHKTTRIRPNRAPESRRTGGETKLFGLVIHV